MQIQAIEASPSQGATPSLPFLGDLAERPPCRLLWAVYQEHFSGILTVDDGWANKVLTFSEGRLVSVTSNLIGERFGRMLVSLGFMTEDQRMEMLRKITEDGGSEEEAVLALGFLHPNQLEEVHRNHLAQRFMELFTWRRGRFRLTRSSVEMTQAPERLALPRLIYAGIQKYYDIETIQRWLGAAYQTPFARDLSNIEANSLTLTDPGRSDLAQFLRELPQEDARLLKILDGTKTIEKISQALGVEEIRVARSLYFLHLTGLVKSVDWEDIIESKLGEIDMIDLSMTSFGMGNLRL